jgi:hypothetical protein
MLILVWYKNIFKHLSSSVTNCCECTFLTKNQKKNFDKKSCSFCTTKTNNGNNRVKILGKLGYRYIGGRV